MCIFGYVIICEKCQRNYNLFFGAEVFARNFAHLSLEDRLCLLISGIPEFWHYTHERTHARAKQSENGEKGVRVGVE